MILPHVVEKNGILVAYLTAPDRELELMSFPPDAKGLLGFESTPNPLLPHAF